MRNTQMEVRPSSSISSRPFAITAAEADLAARLRRSEGWRLPDALQAAVARHNMLDLVTRNTKDFPPDRYDFVTVPYAIEGSGRTPRLGRR